MQQAGRRVTDIKSEAIFLMLVLLLAAPLFLLGRLTSSETSILACFIVFLIYIPGRFLAFWLGLRRSLNELLGASFALGIIALPLTFSIVFTVLPEVLTQKLRAHGWWLLAYGAVALIGLSLQVRKHRLETEFSLREGLLLVFIMGVALAGVMGFVMPNTELNFGRELTIVGPFCNDSFLHIAFMGEYLRTAAPQNPTFAGVPVRGYHTFHDILPALIYEVVPLEPMVLYFRILPYLYALAAGLIAAAAVRRRCQAGPWVGGLTAALVLLGGDFTYIATWLQGTFMMPGKELTYFGSFSSILPWIHFQDCFLLMQFFTGVALLTPRHTPRRVRHQAAAAILWAALAYSQLVGFMVLTLGLAVFLGFRLIRFCIIGFKGQGWSWCRNATFSGIFIASYILTAIPAAADRVKLFNEARKLHHQMFVLTPGWFMEGMWPNLSSLPAETTEKIIHGLSFGPWLVLLTISLGLFVVAGFGIRSLFLCLRLCSGKRMSELELLLLLCMGIGIFMSFFVSARYTYLEISTNTLFFFNLTSIWFGDVIVMETVGRLMRTRTILARSAMFVLLIAAAVPSTIRMFAIYRDQRPESMFISHISTAEFGLFQALRATPLDALVLINNPDHPEGYHVFTDRHFHMSLGLRRFVVFNHFQNAKTPYYFPGFEERYQDSRLFFGTPDADLAKSILAKYRASYVALIPGEELRFPVENLLDSIYDRDGFSLFAVKPGIL